MKTRLFEKSKWFRGGMIILVGCVIAFGVLQVLAAPPEVPPERPAAALYAVSWNTAVITQTTTASSATTQHYAYHDVTCKFNFADNQQTQAVTITLQASNDDSDWFQTFAFTAITTDTTVTTGIISRTLSYGRYERMVLTVSNTNQVTPTCKSVFFNNWAPANYAQSLDH